VKYLKYDKIFYFIENNRYWVMEFENKQYDGLYGTIKLELKNKNELLKGLIYLPPKAFNKPYPLIIYFHGFPQLFSLKEIIENYKFLLDSGYAFLTFNFRGYKDSEGEISLTSHLSDAINIISSLDNLADQELIDLSNLNLIGQDFGAFIALLLCSKIKNINRLLLLSPILDLRAHVYSEGFAKNLHYINNFLPDSVRGINDINKFIKLTKKELSKKDYDIERAIKNLNLKKLMVIHGEDDKITPMREVKEMLDKINPAPQLIFIKSMEHEHMIDEEMEDVCDEIAKFFK
jgi:pimeloyl-ACP methyl ester carboxylesterase